MNIAQDEAFGKRKFIYFRAKQQMSATDRSGQLQGVNLPSPSNSREINNLITTIAIV